MFKYQRKPAKPRQVPKKFKPLAVSNSALARNLGAKVSANAMAGIMHSNPTVRQGLASGRKEVRKFFKALVFAVEKSRILEKAESAALSKAYRGPFYGDWILVMLKPYFEELKSFRGSPEEFYKRIKMLESSGKAPFLEAEFLASFPPKYSKKSAKSISKKLEK